MIISYYNLEDAPRDRELHLVMFKTHVVKIIFSYLADSS